MFPLKDDIPTRTLPVVTIGLIILNVIAYLYQLSLQGAGPTGDPAIQAFIFEFGLIPCRLTAACPTPSDGPSAPMTIFTSMFLHGGLLHIGGNMLYLWIFGNNVEDTLGHGRFTVFYLLSGVAAAILQTMGRPDSAVPMIGASGAVAGVLGAYLVLFPRARVLTLIWFFFYFRFVYLSALWVLGFWIVVQFLSGFASLGAGPEEAEGGVAFFAHIGGFLAGMILLFALRPRAGARA